MVEKQGAVEAKILSHIELQEMLEKQKQTQDSESKVTNPLWTLVLKQRLELFPKASKGVWVASVASGVSGSFLRCVAHVDVSEVCIENRGGGIDLFGRPGRGGGRGSSGNGKEDGDTEDGRKILDPRDSKEKNEEKEENGEDSAEEMAVRQVLKASMNLIREERTRAANSDCQTPSRLCLRFASLDAALVPLVQRVLQEENGRSVQRLYQSPCGLWITEQPSGSAGSEAPLPPHARLRNLVHEDAPLVNSRWEYNRGEGSLPMIQRMIALNSAGCWGVVVDDDMEEGGERLVAWICGYLDGPLGMLWTEPGHRRQGFAAAVAQAAVAGVRCASRGAPDAVVGANPSADPVTAFIVESNKASQSLFTRMGWRRVASADWVGLAAFL
uniref:N-acetyltransferase domain-containing protein n=1 Tax=Chromera velia CCMP2878 TaxID=1169474 RepID=A0A0G4HXY1_9ALVE|eukprot:Cvel_33355.t1-p1 / transcript=Cvel_33355.t1 / gene=Cvel_33355 / organism=Chromera_velia_CCMP2878 / gene_product=hypothetical protein / transcript_product=hypothetical protein / location=Cvel_scaffold5394:2201-3352(-) / protein_length=384 / sequence_SO=supercontig / SO=protein_coding / is_pseudo=false